MALPHAKRQAEARKRRIEESEKVWLLLLLLPLRVKIVALILASLALVDRFNIPERVGGCIQIETAKFGARGSNTQAIIKWDGGKLG